LILEAAAEVFDELGYEAASITEIMTRSATSRGSMYFHFPSKADLARSILAEQTVRLDLPPNVSKLQEIIDVTALFAHRLLSDPILRAGTRLTLERSSVEFPDTNPYRAWAGMVEDLLLTAQQRGEVLNQVDARETAELIVGSFAGIQSFSHTVTDRQDLGSRVSAMWKHLLPAIATPAAMARLDFAPDRGPRLAAIAAAAADDAAPREAAGA
jgi:AcrR family transcriptional regulator